jgi:hypothetical protein
MRNIFVDLRLSLSDPNCGNGATRNVSSVIEGASWGKDGSHGRFQIYKSKMNNERGLMRSAVKKIAILSSILILNLAASSKVLGSCDEMENLGDKKYLSVLKLLVTTESPEAMKGEGDFIHLTWQTINSYKTRYKPMKGPDGKPVTDIAEYIRSRNIPAEYRAYYRKTTKGTYEEDIKKIPNQWLASNNSNENSRGAKSYVENLYSLLTDTDVSDANRSTKIVDSLKAIHVDYFKRMEEMDPGASSWAARTFDEAGIEAQYNGAMQYYKIAERHGVLNDPKWMAAFDRVVGDLARAKFEPFKDLSVQDAYLALTTKAGTKPSIEADGHMEKFFGEKLQSYDFAMPAERSKESSAVASFLALKFPRLASQELKITAPPVPPGTSARVYLVKGPSGNLLAVMKIQSGAAGLNEVVSTVTVESMLDNDTASFKPAKTLGFGKLQGGDYFTLQEAAHDFEADSTFKSAANSSTRQWMVEKVSETLAAVHGPFKNLSPEEAKAKKADLTTFQGNCFYDVRKMTEYFPGGRNDVVAAALQQSVIAAEDVATLINHFQGVTTKYSEIVELRPESLDPTKIHGDYHGGNQFVSARTNSSMLIDYGGVTWFIGKKGGTGDRGNDVGRMLGNILTEATRHRLDFNGETLPLMEKLIRDYKAHTGIVPGSVNETSFDVSVMFYMNRFVAVNAMDLAGKKFKVAVAGDSPSSLRTRLFKNWVQAIRHFGSAI